MDLNSGSDENVNFGGERFVLNPDSEEYELDRGGLEIVENLYEDGFEEWMLSWDKEEFTTYASGLYEEDGAWYVAEVKEDYSTIRESELHGDQPEPEIEVDNNLSIPNRFDR